MKFKLSKKNPVNSDGKVGIETSRNPFFANEFSLHFIPAFTDFALLLL